MSWRRRLVRLRQRWQRDYWGAPYEQKIPSHPRWLERLNGLSYTKVGDRIYGLGVYDDNVHVPRWRVELEEFGDEPNPPHMRSDGLVGPEPRLVMWAPLQVVYLPDRDMAEEVYEEWKRTLDEILMERKL